MRKGYPISKEPSASGFGLFARLDQRDEPALGRTGKSARKLFGDEASVESDLRQAHQFTKSSARQRPGDEQIRRDFSVSADGSAGGRGPQAQSDLVGSYQSPRGELLQIGLTVDHAAMGWPGGHHDPVKSFDDLAPMRRAQGHGKTIGGAGDRSEPGAAQHERALRDAAVQRGVDLRGGPESMHVPERAQMP